MNLRHNKPAQSYSEPINLPKLAKKDRVKQDPLLKLHAEQLVKFINRANQRLSQYKKLQHSKNKPKQTKQKRVQTIVNKNTKKKAWSPSSNKYLRTYISSEIESETNTSIGYQLTKIENNGQFQFETLKHEWEAEPSNHVSTLMNMTRLCMSQPKYYPILQRMHNEKHFIQNFNPSQLSFPNSLLVYRLLSSSGHHRA